MADEHSEEQEDEVEDFFSAPSDDEPHEAPTEQSISEYKSTSGCEHYARDCLLQAPCCGEWFSCRFCHDKAKNDEEPDFKKSHTMDRHAVTLVRCLACQLEQPVFVYLDDAAS